MIGLFLDIAQRENRQKRGSYSSSPEIIYRSNVRFNGFKAYNLANKLFAAEFWNIKQDTGFILNIEMFVIRIVYILMKYDPQFLHCADIHCDSEWHSALRISIGVQEINNDKDG